MMALDFHIAARALAEIRLIGSLDDARFAELWRAPIPETHRE
jgi:hypothetical protein